MLAAACRSSKERNLFVVSLIFSAVIWLLIVVSIVGLLYAPFVAMGVVIAHAFAMARITGNSIRLGSRQLPELYKRVENAASKLGLERMPEVYVMTGGGILNAFATKLFSRSFIILHAEILDACEAADEGKDPTEPRTVDFIIGHELGHLALGHLSMNWLLWPAKIVPLLGAAYSRACEYSCDACGLAATSATATSTSNDVETAGRALALLSAGGRQTRHINLDALIEQRHETGSFIMALVELNATHPYLSKRVAAVRRLRDDGMAPEVGRNPFSYMLAPFFAGASTYVMAYVVLIAIFAASAAPEMMSKFKDLLVGTGTHTIGGPVAVMDQAEPTQEAPAEPKEGAAPTFAELLAQVEQQGQVGAFANGAVPSETDAIGGFGTGRGVGGELVAEVGDDGASPRFEARTWLKGQLVGKNAQAVANTTTAKAAAFADKLHRTGAAKVWVSSIELVAGSPVANELIAELPSNPAVRKKLVDLCTAEFAKQGSSEPCQDPGAEGQLYFYWD